MREKRGKIRKIESIFTNYLLIRKHFTLSFKVPFRSNPGLVHSLDGNKLGWDDAMLTLIALLPDTDGCKKANRRITETASRVVDGLKEDQKTD